MYELRRYDEVEAEYMTLVKRKRRKIMKVHISGGNPKLIDTFEPYLVGCHLENAPSGKLWKHWKNLKMGMGAGTVINCLKNKGREK